MFTLDNISNLSVRKKPARRYPDQSSNLSLAEKEEPSPEEDLDQLISEHPSIKDEKSEAFDFIYGVDSLFNKVQDEPLVLQSSRSAQPDHPSSLPVLAGVAVTLLIAVVSYTFANAF